MPKSSNRTEDWHEGIELLTVWFKKPLKEDGSGFIPQDKTYSWFIPEKFIRSYNKEKRRVEFQPCLIEIRDDYVHLSFPFPKEDFRALFASKDTVVSGAIFGSSSATSIRKSTISRMQRSGKRMFRRRNPTCNWCEKESDRRAAIKLPEDTPPERAWAMEDGKPYGKFFWGCNGCLQRNKKRLDLHIFND